MLIYRLFRCVNRQLIKGIGVYNYRNRMLVNNPGLFVKIEVKFMVKNSRFHPPVHRPEFKP